MNGELLNLHGGADTIAHVIQVALTPVFLLSGIASLLGVFSTRLARVADRVDALMQLSTASPVDKIKLQRLMLHLRRRSHLLDAAVVLGTSAGGATCFAAVFLFVGTLRDQTGEIYLFASFGLALLCTIGALSAFLAEVLVASRGVRDQVASSGDDIEAADAPEDDRSGGDAEHTSIPPAP